MMAIVKQNITSSGTRIAALFSDRHLSFIEKNAARAPKLILHQSIPVGLILCGRGSQTFKIKGTYFNGKPVAKKK